jgi:hypothetical protein
MATATLDFYRAQAQRSQAEADAAILDNVRDRCLRAKAAWASMADRLEMTDTLRATRLGSAL